MFGYKSDLEKRVICSYVTCIKLIGFSMKIKLILILNYLVIKFNTTITNKNIWIYVYYTLNADKALSNWLYTGKLNIWLNFKATEISFHFKKIKYTSKLYKINMDTRIDS